MSEKSDYDDNENEFSDTSEELLTDEDRVADVENDEEEGVLSEGSSEADHVAEQELRKQEHPLLSLGSFTQNVYDDDIESDDSWSSMDDDVQERFLLNQQENIALDFKQQEEHENNLRLIREGLSRKKKFQFKSIASIGFRVWKGFKNWWLQPDKLWVDIFYLLITHMQYCGAIWIFPYILPENVYRWTQFSIYFNLDFVSHRENLPNLISSGLYNPPFYPHFLLLWLVIPPLIFTIWLLLPYLKYVTRFHEELFVVDRFLFTLLRILYFPFMINTYSYGFCGGRGKPAFKCTPFCTDEFGLCLTRSVPAALMVIYFALGMPLAMYLASKKLIIYQQNVKHLNYLRNVEVEKKLKISNNYVLYRFHMISSYTRFGAKYVLLREFAQKFFLILAWGSLDGLDHSGEASWRSQVAISSIAFGLIIIPLVIEMFVRPFRNLSYFLVSQLLGWISVFNFALAWFKALNVKSPFLLPSSLFTLIMIVNFIVLAAVFALLALMLLFKTRWPINEVVVGELLNKYEHYLKGIRDGYMLYEHAIATSPPFIPVDMLIYHKKFMTKLLHEAHLERNPLEETIEDVILKLEEEYYANKPLSLLPHKSLQAGKLIQLRAQFDRRDMEMILIPPQKRIFLLKLLALRTIQGNHILKRYKIGEEPEDDHQSEASSQSANDMATIEKLNKFLEKHDIFLQASDSDSASSASEKDEIDRLLDVAGKEMKSSKAKENAEADEDEDDLLLLDDDDDDEEVNDTQQADKQQVDDDDEEDDEDSDSD